MIRKCSIEDLQLIADFVYSKNSQPEHSSAYCSKRYDSIFNEFRDLLESDKHFVVGCYDEAQCVGVMGLYVDAERNCADCIGPFIEGDFNHIGKGLFDFIPSVNH